MILARYTILIAVLSVSVPLHAAKQVSVGAYWPMTGDVAAYGQLAWIGITTAQKMEPKVLRRPVELRLAAAYFIILDATTRAGSTDPEKIRNALAATYDFEGVTGRITIKPDGNAIKAMIINEAQDGKFVYVTTISPADF
jgi:ABC-type branched-subunit amino acid transport system substrate-binding protein